MRGRILWFFLVPVFFVTVSGPARSETFCGKATPGNSAVALIAVAAHDLCPDIAAISDDDAGTMLLADGINMTAPGCEKDVARATLRIKAEHAQDEAGWCSRARAILASHPMTRDLVSAAKACGELDRAAALIAEAEGCRFEVTEAGEAASTLPNSPACVVQRRQEYAESVKALGKLAGSAAKGRRTWCDRLLSDHTQQFTALGMPVWFKRK